MASYAELFCQTAFSFHEGASMPEDLARTAAELGVSALGVCDRDSVYGMVRAWKTGKDHGMDVLHGALLSVLDPSVHAPGGPRGAKGPDRTGLLEVAVYAQDADGWGSLCELLSVSHTQAAKGSGLLHLPQLLEHTHGLVGLIDGAWPTPAAGALAEQMGDALYLHTSRELQPSDAPREARTVALAQHLNRPIVAVNRVLLHTPDRKPLQDVLTCIRTKQPLSQAGTALLPNAERHIRAPRAMLRRFSDRPTWVTRTLDVAERCRFRLDQLAYEYPHEVVPDGHTPQSYLVELTYQGLAWRWPEGVPDGILEQIEHELGLIEELNFPAYFLTVYDIVRFAREQRILCQGRGSAANSVVCYALGITAVDPTHQRVLFERFISKERDEPPDIDVDFEHERREEVLQYVYNKYGRHRAAMVNEIISYRSRSAIRDVGKAMGLSLDQVDRLAKTLDWYTSGEMPEEQVREAGLDPADPRLKHTLELAAEIQGFPRHLSIHTGGFVISEQELRRRCPIEPASMENRTVIQWDKDDIDAVGFVKVDCLALGMLTALRKCFDLIEHHHGHAFTLATVPSEDPFVYDMICRADTIGTFQIESRAQMSMLPRLKPRCFYDLVVEVSIVRPGPIQGGMVHPYLARRSGEVPVTYAHPDLKPILQRTLGVPIFQEQVMEMAMVVGGFSAGESDALRRAMGAWRKRGGLEPLVERLQTNMIAKGLDAEYAARVAKQIIGFGEYGFPESHAASFALLVYVSCFVKCYFPAAFCAALLNSQPMGFYSARSLLTGARDHGVQARPVRISVSSWNNTLEDNGRVSPLQGGRDGVVAHGVDIRLGLRQIAGLGQDAAERIEAARDAAPFTSVPDLARRAELNKRDLLCLARADALRCLGLDRRQACWEVEGLWGRQTPLLKGLQRQDHHVPLPEPTAYEDLQQDYLATGLSLRSHPVGLARAWLDRRKVLRIADLAECDPGDRVRIAGLVVNRQRPGTAKGVVFMTLEDETAMCNLVVWPKLFEKQRQVIRGSQLVQVLGTLQRDGDAVSILALHFETLPLGAVRAPSRDFH